MPVLPLLAFVLDLLMIRAVLFRAVFVQQRDRPLHAAVGPKEDPQVKGTGEARLR